MASILQTDVLELYNTWGERVAFNEGFQAQKIAEAKQGGRDAFSLGIDRSQGQGLYFEAKDQRFSEAKEFLAGEPAAQISDESISDVEPESIEPDQIGDVTDGEETLGMESVVANETVDGSSDDVECAGGCGRSIPNDGGDSCCTFCMMANVDTTEGFAESDGLPMTGDIDDGGGFDADQEAIEDARWPGVYV